MRPHADIVVIGGGPAGFAAAARAAELGATVTLIERDTLGGTCVNRGCMPTLTLLKAAETLSLAANAGRFGVSFESQSVSWSTLRERQELAVEGLRSGVESATENLGIEVLRGQARLAGPNAVSIGGGAEEGTVTARSIIIASGAESVRPSVAGAQGPGVIDPDDALRLAGPAQSLVVVGATAIGLSLARIYLAFGSEVTVLEQGPQVLPGEDVDAADCLAGELELAGATIQYGARVQHIGNDGAGQFVRVATDAAVGELHADKVVFAGPRRPVRHGLGLDTVGVQTVDGAIAVDDRLQTSVAGIYAAGDVTGRLPLSHVAAAQGRAAAEIALGRDSRVRYRLVPRCVYTIPEFAAVGLTEQQAQESGREVRVGLAWFAANPKAQMVGETAGLVKLIVDARFGEILGAHIVGPRAHDLITLAAFAMGLEATVGDLANLLFPHPAFAEALLDAARMCQ